jgi:hypothetical protein
MKANIKIYPKFGIHTFSSRGLLYRNAYGDENIENLSGHSLWPFVTLDTMNLTHSSSAVACEASVATELSAEGARALVPEGSRRVHLPHFVLPVAPALAFSQERGITGGGRGIGRCQMLDSIHESSYAHCAKSSRTHLLP